MRKVDYNSMTVTFKNAPCKEALVDYYCLLIDVLMEKYGKDAVRIALEELINEHY
ncbi:hypothetical protein [Clostridium sp. HBUAS56017]|uniref:hypothetical protein n=1 Tax=Clostridium sp. HBUAS56017 TaxID=2571128 RepID=UPI00163DCC27|nr:hypothetical protein [Clostridium sp. HBUAS56017]